MKGDFSRLTFDRRRRYGGVLLQQGRVQTDADWNEQEAIERYRAQALARDLIGPCGGPRDAAGFAIRVQAGRGRASNGGRLVIGAGRYWVDGILAENEADVAYEAQPDLPDPPDWRSVAEGGDGRGGATSEGNGLRGLVYLDVWERFVTAVEDPSLRDPALGGPDTSGRVKTVWQVRVLPLGVASSGTGSAPGETDTCAADAAEWAELAADRMAGLTARVGPGGYAGLENQLYRVEVHRPGKTGGATFKWSRDNGSVVSPIRAVEGREVVLAEGSPDVLRFAPGQWVELSDDRFELHCEAGELARVDRVDEVARRITLATEPSAVGSVGGTLDTTRHPKVRGWDQVERATPDGVPVAGTWIGLEHGIEVRFGPGGTYRTGDYWSFPARTAGHGSGGSIEWARTSSGGPEPQPPHGIAHHYCPLALLERPSTKAPWRVSRDCRKLFGPLARADG